MRDAVMRDKARTTPEEAADKINDAVDDLTLKVAGTAVDPNAERVAANVSDQVERPEISESASLPKHIDPTSSVLLLANVRATLSKSLHRPLLRRSRLKIKQEQQRKEDQR
jgi:hypothetical protein